MIAGAVANTTGTAAFPLGGSTERRGSDTALIRQAGVVRLSPVLTPEARTGAAPLPRFPVKSNQVSCTDQLAGRGPCPFRFYFAFFLRAWSMAVFNPPHASHWSPAVGPAGHETCQPLLFGRSAAWTPL